MTVTLLYKLFEIRVCDTWSFVLSLKTALTVWSLLCFHIILLLFWFIDRSLSFLIRPLSPIMETPPSWPSLTLSTSHMPSKCHHLGAYGFNILFFGEHKYSVHNRSVWRKEINTSSMYQTSGWLVNTWGHVVSSLVRAVIPMQVNHGVALSVDLQYCMSWTVLPDYRWVIIGTS